MSEFGRTIAAAPNFAYGYAADRVRDDELAGADLSTWRILFRGGEPIQVETIRRFVERFTRSGLPRNGFRPSCGMAEATLAVSISRPNEPVVVEGIDRQAAVRDALAVDVDPGDPAALKVSPAGAPVAGTELRVVDNDGSLLGENQIGHIQFRSAARTAGYYALQEETAAAVDAPDWWTTGDLDYLRDGAVRITEREKT